jgi:hypothetical protein
MADQTDAPDPAPIKDRRSVPLGVLPRGFQTWLMGALALGIVLIVVLTGHREPPARPAIAPMTPAPPNTDRVRDYQDQLRTVEERMAREAQAAIAETPPPKPEVEAERQVKTPEDAIAAERRRREYESLFASNVVLSRRLETQRADAPTPPVAARPSSDRSSISIDDIADAVVRATMRTSTVPTSDATPVQTPQSEAAKSPTDSSRNERERTRRRERARSVPLARCIDYWRARSLIPC